MSTSDYTSSETRVSYNGKPVEGLLRIASISLATMAVNVATKPQQTDTS